MIAQRYEIHPVQVSQWKKEVSTRLPEVFAKPSAKVRDEIVHHSDRGSIYASDRYQRLLAKLKMHPSMSAKGNCYDNAAMESFFGRYKTAAVRDHVFTNEGQVRANVFNYTEVFYNRYRKHASLGYLSPMQAEAKFSPPMGGNEVPDCLTRN